MNNITPFPLYTPEQLEEYDRRVMADHFESVLFEAALEITDTYGNRADD